ncbi:quinone-dependent dihydroorotate dehydrogenase [Candidatus Roizmanbacteria bacterium]|nr:quinone-dependent dihydroorotate dehydrogenase [Candidatus Roizmanbacteria bacterium]
MKWKVYFFLLLLAVLGLIDASYLTYEHFSKIIPPCTVNRFLPFLSDCGKVLESKYSIVLGVPIALIGLIHYTLLFIGINIMIFLNKKIVRLWVLLQTMIGAFFSIYLMYLQLFVIKSICIYCTYSAIISFFLFILTFFFLEKERKTVFVLVHGYIYRNFFKRVFFLFDSEIIHTLMVNIGELFGKLTFIKKLFGFYLFINDPSLEQKITRINFKNPVGLAAGFDYNAQLTQILPSIGFGFGSVGTITNFAYGGNPKPLLGRLPKSQSLIVNKGFKNPGAKKIIEKLKNSHFSIPVGISIGRTNIKTKTTQNESVQDIVNTFNLFEQSTVKNSYYELNISCPNLYGNISFYPPKNLEELLKAVQKIWVKKPIFVKMPIEKNNDDFLAMLKIIEKYKYITGIIIGNLQKNRKDPSLDPEEVKKWKVGYFSGKPCEQRSNELIKLTREHFGKRFVIIGCGGIFSAEDAYRKIKLGASLVQLITGMIYNGPTLISRINLELVELLHKDGYKHISEAVGTGL